MSPLKQIISGLGSEDTDQNDDTIGWEDTASHQTKTLTPVWTETSVLGCVTLVYKPTTIHGVKRKPEEQITWKQ